MTSSSDFRRGWALRAARVRRGLPFVAIGLSVLYGLGLFLGSSTLLGIAWVAFTVTLAVSMGAIAMMAGVLVIKSLFVVAAELSLLIFLTQSYCLAGGRLPQNNAALDSLFTISVIYIVAIFGQSLWEALKLNYEKIEDRPRSVERTITVIAFLLFVGVFVWQLYLVISPIVRDLCVYK